MDKRVEKLLNLMLEGTFLEPDGTAAKEKENSDSYLVNMGTVADFAEKYMEFKRNLSEDVLVPGMLPTISSRPEVPPYSMIASNAKDLLEPTGMFRKNLNKWYVFEKEPFRLNKKDKWGNGPILHIPESLWLFWDAHGKSGLQNTSWAQSISDKINLDEGVGPIDAFVDNCIRGNEERVLFVCYWASRRTRSGSIMRNGGVGLRGYPFVRHKFENTVISEEENIVVPTVRLMNLSIDTEIFE